MKKPFSLVLFRSALRMAIREGALTPEEAGKFGEALTEAAMALEIGADEMRMGSPIITRRYASALGDIGMALEEAACEQAKPKLAIEAGKTYKVGELDMEGLQGREHHPAKADVGRIVRTLEVSETVFGGEDMTDGFRVWLCLVGEGNRSKLLQLADYELEEA